MTTIDNIPVYEGRIDEGEDLGIVRISLVDSPAVMSDFLAFKEEKKPMQFAIADEEKHLVFGVIMRADFPIYRISNGMEYYMIFHADTIRAMAQKYLSESRQNNVDLDHDGEEIGGVQMVQWFLKDSEKGVNPTGFDNIADGSLFAEFKVLDESVWKEIKEGTYKGFSLEGFFDLQPEENEEYINQAVQKADGKFSNTMNQKLQELKEKFGNLVGEKFADLTTDKGILRYDGEELAEGLSVVLVDAEGNESAPEDGEYIAEDKVVTIEGGKIIKIEDKVVEEEVEETEEELAEEETKEEESKEELAEPVSREEFDALKNEFAEYRAKQEEEVNELYKIVDGLMKEVGTTRDAVEQMSKQSAGKDAHEASIEEEKPSKESRYTAMAKAIRGE